MIDLPSEVATKIPEGEEVTAEAALAFMDELKRAPHSRDEIIASLQSRFPTADWEAIKEAHDQVQMNKMRRKNNAF